MSVDEEYYTPYDWFEEGRVAEVKGDYKRAIECYEHAIKLKPDFGKAWYYKAKAHLQLGEKQKAIECAKKALEFKPEWKSHIDKILEEAM